MCHFLFAGKIIELIICTLPPQLCQHSLQVIRWGIAAIYVLRVAFLGLRTGALFMNSAL